MALPLFHPQLGERQAPIEIDLSEFDLAPGVLIRSTNWLGDVVMSLPGMFRLCDHLPADVPKTVVCPRALTPLWQAVPWVSEVVGFKGKRVDGDALKRVKEIQPAFSVILPNSFGSAWDLWRAGLPHRIGRAGRGRTMLLDHKLPEYRRVPGKDRFHQARLYLEFAACCGVESWDNTFPALQIDVDRQTREVLDVDRKDLLVVAPCAAYGPAKQWPVERFREVVAWWCKEVGPAVAVGTRKEAETAAQVVDGIDKARNLAGETSMRELIYVLSQARCVVANDSGAMHLAAAVDRDGVAIFGSTDPLATGPIGGRWIVLQDRLECAPCCKRKCKRDDHPYECLDLISTPAVITALTELLG